MSVKIMRTQSNTLKDLINICIRYLLNNVLIRKKECTQYNKVKNK